MFDEDEGWEEARDEDGIKTMYRYEEGLSTITVRIEGILQTLRLVHHVTFKCVPVEILQEGR